MSHTPSTPDSLKENSKTPEVPKLPPEKPKQQNVLPLRQRTLPASFWREPNKPKEPLLPQISCGLSYCTQCQLMAAQKRYPEPLSPTLRFHHQFPPLDTPRAQQFPPIEAFYNGLHGHQKFNPFMALPPSSGLLWNLPGGHCVDPKISASHLSAVPPSLSQISAAGIYSQPDGSLDLSTSIHKPPVWRPIPTKTLSTYSSRFHPFADVR